MNVMKIVKKMKYYFRESILLDVITCTTYFNVNLFQ
jgi:hypothetical protein